MDLLWGHNPNPIEVWEREHVIGAIIIVLTQNNAFGLGDSIGESCLNNCIRVCLIKFASRDYHVKKLIHFLKIYIALNTFPKLTHTHTEVFSEFSISSCTPSVYIKSDL